jgi:phosphoribosylglycinamide formyltransferase-1
MSGTHTRTKSRLPIVVLLSGNGSNFKAILDAIHNDGLPVEVCAVISNRADAQGLIYAQYASIQTLALNPDDYSDRETFDQAMQELIDTFEPALVVLAGYMRILTNVFVQHYTGRLINIHPSLLPDFRGLNTHQRVIEAGVKQHGASVHFVVEELDSGPVVLQKSIPVIRDDNRETLASRVLIEEHRLYPVVLRWFAEGRLDWNNGQVLLDGLPLTSPKQLTT